MSPRPATDLYPDRDLRALFGSRVRTHRELHGMTLLELANEVHFAPGYVGLVEHARRTPHRHFAVAVDEVFNTHGELTALWPMLMRGSLPSWFRTFIELEASATAQRAYMPQQIFGPFQTEEYARARIAWDRKLGYGDAWIEEQVGLRMERQRKLFELTPPQELVVVLDEGALRRPVGSPRTMREQLQRLIELSSAPGVFYQVLPFSAGDHMCMEGALQVLTVPKHHDVVYEESYGYGQVFDRPERVNECIVRFDQVRAAALSVPASIALIQRIMEDT